MYVHHTHRTLCLVKLLPGTTVHLMCETCSYMEVNWLLCLIEELSDEIICDYRDANVSLCVLLLVHVFVQRLYKIIYQTVTSPVSGGVCTLGVKL